MTTSSSAYLQALHQINTINSLSHNTISDMEALSNAMNTLISLQSSLKNAVTAAKTTLLTATNHHRDLLTRKLSTTNALKAHRRTRQQHQRHLRTTCQRLLQSRREGNGISGDPERELRHYLIACEVANVDRIDGEMKREDKDLLGEIGILDEEVEEAEGEKLRVRGVLERCEREVEEVERRRGEVGG